MNKSSSNRLIFHSHLLALLFTTMPMALFGHSGEPPLTPYPTVEVPDAIISGTQAVCPPEAPKTQAGECGCYIIDEDRNENSITDCHAKDDLKAQIEHIRSIIREGEYHKPSLKFKLKLTRAITRTTRFVRTWRSRLNHGNSQIPVNRLAAKVRATILRVLYRSNAPQSTVVAQIETQLDQITTLSTAYRLFLGTGEYSPSSNWDAILRFNDIDSLPSGVQSVADGTTPIKQLTDTNGVALNFGHSLFYDASRDEMYVASLFTTTGSANACTQNQTTSQCGSIGVYANASSANGPQTLVRHIFGSATSIIQPHGIWVDTTRDILYAANTFGSNILVWNNASTATGNIAPTRTISYSSLGKPVHLYVDEASDLMFVVSMNSGITQKGGAVFIFKAASTLSGSVTPLIRIYGSNTRLDSGNNQTTHNVWYDSGHKLLFVGHHTNEVLIFDLSTVDFQSSTTSDIAPTPRVIKINENDDDSDQYNWSAYGLFYQADLDRLFVAAGNTNGGTATQSGPPGFGLTTHAIRMYNSISNPSKSGRLTPDKNIKWSSVTTYYPPQPLWIAAVPTATPTVTPTPTTTPTSTPTPLPQIEKEWTAPELTLSYTKQKVGSVKAECLASDTPASARIYLQVTYTDGNEKKVTTFSMKRGKKTFAREGNEESYLKLSARCYFIAEKKRSPYSNTKKLKEQSYSAS